MTTHSASTRSHLNPLAWGLTACGVVAGPALLGATQTAPPLMLVSVAIGLTALLIGFAIRQRARDAAVSAPIRRRVRALAWSPP